jgi:hypothetical protein
MDATGSSSTSLPIYKTIRRHNSEDDELNLSTIFTQNSEYYLFNQ